MESYTNKVFIPYREDSVNQRSSRLEIVKAYYERHGFEVILCDSDTERFNKFAAMNSVFKNYDVDIATIVNADMIVPHYFIKMATEIVSETGHVVKPFNRIVGVSLNDEDFVRDILEEEVVSSLQFFQAFPEFHFGGAWTISRASWQECGGWEESYELSGLGNFELAFLASVTGGICYIESLSYSFIHSSVMPYWDTQAEINRLELTRAFFRDSACQVYIKSGSELHKFSNEQCKRLFDMDRYIEEYQIGNFLSKTPSSTSSEKK